MPTRPLSTLTGRRSPRPWTDEDLGVLAEGLQEGRSFPELGVLLERSGDAVRAKAIEVGLWNATARPAPQKRRQRSGFNAMFGD